MLTYRVTKYPSRRLSRSEVVSRNSLMDKSNLFAQVDSSVRAAFAMWTGITDFSFTLKRSGSVHLEIRFVR